MINVEESYDTSAPRSLNTNQKAASAYSNNFQRNLSPYMILLELYKGMLKNVVAAKNAYRNKDLGKMCLYNQKNFMIISALQSHLDLNEGTKISGELDKFYRALFHSLVKVLNAPSPLEEFESIERSIQNVHSFWIKVGDIGFSQTSEMNTNMPFNNSDKTPQTGIDIA